MRGGKEREEYKKRMGGDTHGRKDEYRITQDEKGHTQ